MLFRSVKAGDECIIAVKADNSDDKNYPPGKKQAALDFCYHGGMYRDVWLIGKSPIAITDANEQNSVAGGGAFLHFDNISEKKADVFVNVEVGNKSTATASPTVIVRIKDKGGKVVATTLPPLSFILTITVGDAVAVDLLPTSTFTNTSAFFSEMLSKWRNAPPPATLFCSLASVMAIGDLPMSQTSRYIPPW